MAVNFKKLDNALKKMEGTLKSFPLDPITGSDRIVFKMERGVEINREEFEDIDPISGFLNFKNHHAFLYIDEPFANLEELKEIPCERGPKFHIIKECVTLQRMHNDGRSNRYILIQNKNGEFPCHPRDTETRLINYDVKHPAKLLACANCMKALNYKGYTSKSIEQRKKDIRSLNINNFLKYYAPFFIDSKYYRENKMDQLGNYSIDHTHIRDKLLKKTNYTCQGSELKSGKCDVRLEDHPEWLHLHHINGRSGDNSPSNIKILCISCHSRQPLHTKMKVPAKAIAEITRRRRKTNQN